MATLTVGDGSPPVDLRLAVPAVATWLVAALVAGMSARATTVVAGALTLAALGAILRGLRRPAAAAPRVLAAVLCCASAVAWAIGWRAASRDAAPLAELARSRAVVEMKIVLTSDPQQLTDFVVGARRVDGRYLVRARVERLRHATRAWRLRQPVLVLGSGPGWRGRLPSERVRVSGRLGPPRAEQPVSAVLVTTYPPQRLGGPSLLQRGAGRLRAGLAEAADVLPTAERGLLPGLVDGDTSRLPTELREDFRRTGLSHIVAVSGTNVALVLAAVLLVTKRVGFGPRGSAVAAAFGLVGFVVLARPSPSVLRAGVMGAIALFAVVTSRRRAAVPALSGAVIGLLLFSPELARAPGFALSVLATAGLVVLAPMWRAAFARRMPARLADALAVPLAAQVACAPLLAALAGQVSLVAVPANLLAMPAVGAATIAGVVAAVLAPVSMPLAEIAARVGGAPTHWLVVVATRLARLPAASLGWPRGGRGAALVVVVTVVTIAALRRRVGRRVLGALTASVLVAALGVRVVAPGWPVPNWVFVACDVGQGDALVLAAGESAVVVDTGPDPVAVDSCLRDLGIRRVAAVVLTHLHADHVEGLPGVLRGRRVALITRGPHDEPADELARVTAWAARARVPLTVAVAGERRVVGALSYEVLAPTRTFRGTESDPNNSSVVLRVITPQLTLLLTGDIEQPAQRAVLDARPDLRADVVKVPHHGSAKQLAEFLAATRAKVAITTVGRDNPYGHPARSTMRLVSDEGMRGYRTDTDGDIAVAIAEGRLTVVGRNGRGTAPGRPPPLAWTLRPAARLGWCPVRPSDDALASRRVG